MAKRYHAIRQHQARMVNHKLEDVCTAIRIMVGKIGVDYYGLVRWEQHEREFWKKLYSAIHGLQNRVTKKYRL